ncbi:hypothetical protein N5079_34580 [Planotetraspora sp. A-T 1434]|uniref:hypothetical protein n=1 Tax=Planotetraspora sp. A-T 1434 TaxID=2979219 RepID=UPI0021C16D6C|nr:hypothetical protein [Planotetraspora sp. A-T 1434]MCT9935342.1 hypothetical protein [Planotetraspora sp. A-T 1434]
MAGSAVLAAARNNAEWCDAMCRAHGLPGGFTESLWFNPRKAPPYYPDAVTLTPDASVAEVLRLLDRRAVDGEPGGASVKDSFARLDLSVAGFRVLFEAQWILRPAGSSQPPGESRAPTGDVVRWEKIGDESDLREWETHFHGGWDDGLFPAGLLADPTVVILAGRIDGDVVCGSVLNTGDQVVGVSNVFASGCDMDTAWAGTVANAAALFPGRPMVGYERSEDLRLARRHGFTPVGPLRVWLR